LGRGLLRLVQVMDLGSGMSFISYLKPSLFLCVTQSLRHEAMEGEKEDDMEMLIYRALREGGHGDKDMKLIQTSRYGSELSKRLFEGRVVDSEDVLDEGVEEPSGEMSFERKLGNQQGKVCHVSVLLHL
jgi:hypothetical protein